MKILVNMAPLKTGGGQNVALNFLIGLEHVHLEGVELHFLVARNSALHRYLAGCNKYAFTLAPNNPVLRIIFEILLGPVVLIRNRVDIIYSYFGCAMIPTFVPQVAGSADSNLYFPEIDFWQDYGGFQRLKRWLIDRYRIYGVRNASAVVFENPAMERRGRNLYLLSHTRYIRPSLTFPNDTDDLVLPVSLKNKFSCLFLCGWHLNKNVMLIPWLAKVAKERGVEATFILTAPLDNSPIHRQFMKLVRELEVDEFVNVIGSVQKSQLASLYNQIDCVLLLSRLESFSNNIIEAWYFQRPLIVSSEEWARSICENAALFVDRNSVDSVLSAIESVMSDECMTSVVVKNGLNKLSSYPTIQDRVKLEIEYIREVYESR